VPSHALSSIRSNQFWLTEGDVLKKKRGAFCKVALLFGADVYLHERDLATVANTTEPATFVLESKGELVLGYRKTLLHSSAKNIFGVSSVHSAGSEGGLGVEPNLKRQRTRSSEAHRALFAPHAQLPPSLARKLA
jgi:hypothetical protein